jgi:hypothetical protein
MKNQNPNPNAAPNGANGATYGMQSPRKQRNPKSTKLFRGVLARRKAIAKMRLEGVQDGKEIANRLGVSSSTVCRDLKKLDQQFIREASQDIAQHKALDLRRIEAAIGAIWPNVLKGNVQASRALVDLLNRKAKLLGLDAPTRVDMTSDWREEASRMGVDPDELFQDMIGMVAQKLGVLPAMPILDMDQAELDAWTNRNRQN